jgi:diguanylate cyclase (GGDEF)-like protein
LLIDSHTAWTRDIQSVSSFVRSEQARQCNLRSSISVPIIQGQEIVAAMEFFMHDMVEPDPQLLETLSQIGVQIGRVFKRRASAQKLIDDALSDPLTELPNRKMFEARLERLFARRAFDKPTRISLIYIDLDGFKLVNDALGHMAGDRLLVEMAERLQKVVTDYATTPFYGAPDDVLIARMGGDEFTILVEGEHHRQVAVDIAKDIHTCLQPSHYIDANEVRCAASVGIAHDDGNYAVAADLIRDADVAMYDAKAGGHGQTTVFDQTMRDRAVRRLRLEAELRAGLERREFRLHYQPIVDIANGRIAGFEALLRWQHGNKLIQPDEFLHVAEQSGLMNVLGTWVLREACSVAASWSRRGDEVQSFYMSVNVAPSQFLQPDFVELVRDIISTTNVDPCVLVIEVTESAAITNRQRTAKILDELRAMGIRLSLDDFGTGYSSFSHLQTLPFDSIKIDRSFVSGEQTNMSWNIVDAMLSFAKAMDMNVVAEGIETQYQLDRLAEVGCAFGQGFLYDRAITADVALEMLRGRMNYALPTAETVALM